jgi:hypothetical protein
MDRPATVTAAILGVVLIGITVPYFAFGGGGGAGATYNISWSQTTAATGTMPVGTGSQQSLPVVVRDQHVSNVTIEIAGCADSAQNPIQADAVLTYTLQFENATAKDADGQDITGQATCASAGPFTFELGGHPEVGSVKATSDGEAVKKAWSGATNTTGTYTLQFSWSRPPGTIPPLPLPVGQPVFTGTMGLEVQSWRATANAPDQEAPR